MILVATILANLFFWGRGHILFGDARGYYELSKIICQNGLFCFCDDQQTMDPVFHVLFDLRTYGYPLFVAFCSLFTSHETIAVQVVVFSAQLFIYLAVCHFVATNLEFRSGDPRFKRWLFICTALNPFLLIYTTELLTDLLSAVTIYLVLALVLKARLNRREEYDSTGPGRTRHPTAILFSASLLASFSAMVRPANVAIIGALLLIWCVTVALRKRVALMELFVIAVGLFIPLIPQLANNYRTFHKVEPLIVGDLRQ